MLLRQTFQNIDFPVDQWGFQILQVKITWAGLCLKCSSEGEHTAFYRKELAHDCDDIQSAHYKCLEEMVRHAEKPIRVLKGNAEIVAK